MKADSQTKMFQNINMTLDAFCILFNEQRYVMAKFVLKNRTEMLRALKNSLGKDHVATVFMINTLLNIVDISDAEWEKQGQELGCTVLSIASSWPMSVAQSEKLRSKLFSERFFAMASIISLFVGVIVSVVFAHYQFNNKQLLLARANQDMQEIKEIFLEAQKETNKSVFQITGNTCSACPCFRRDEVLMNLNDSDICVAQWKNSLQAALQQLKTFCENYCLERLKRDPWGNPYLLNENEVNNKDPSELRSVGPDGIYGTADDLVIEIPENS